MNEGIYYLRLNGKVEGPYTIGQIYDLWAARKINSQTLFARFEEMDKWQPLSELTLKISAPKMLAPKLPSSEPAPAPAVKQKSLAAPRSEEYSPSGLYQRAQTVSPPEARPGLFASLPTNLFFSFSFAIGFCIVVGAGVAAYSMFFISASADGKEVNQNLLVLKQNGVIAGMGLVLMGGLLIVARQLGEILSAMKSEGSTRGDQKKSHSHSTS